MSKKKESKKRRDGLKILFADDEAALQELMSLELPQMGHQVTVCPDGLTAAAAKQRRTTTFNRNMRTSFEQIVSPQFAP